MDLSVRLDAARNAWTSIVNQILDIVSKVVRPVSMVTDVEKANDK